ncbi:MAG: hydrogenase maturation nickel metallochaperone HypA [Woeseiaceae bacterium]|nr:hydrogenase maturation nickel metallochaperone HypA [Woeseiaceae bacterium]
MHELSVCLALMEQVAAVAGLHRATGVSRIVLDVGPLAGVEPELLKKAFPLAAAGTAAAGAALDIRETDVVVRCSQCERESRATANRLLCAHCGDYRTRIVSGDELVLARVELENVRPTGDTPDASASTKSNTLQ